MSNELVNTLYEEGRTVKEIAEAMGTAPSDVHDLLAKTDDTQTVQVVRHQKHIQKIRRVRALADGMTMAYIEKPLASSVAQCEELVNLAKHANLTLMVGHTFIYSSPVRMIKQIIDSGELGELQYINSRRLNLGLFQKDINVTWDLAPHDISIILYILDEMPRRVGCHGKAHITSGIEDVTHMALNFSNGGFALVHNSWLDPNKVREMTFVGTEKMLVYDDIEPTEKIKIYDKRVQKPPHYETFAEFQYSYHYGDMNVPYIKQVEPLKVECQHFIDCIKTGSKSESCGIEGTKVIQILEAASKSLSDGGGEVAVI
jgi:predicted dehydrogenase